MPFCTPSGRLFKMSAKLDGVGNAGSIPAVDLSKLSVQVGGTIFGGCKLIVLRCAEIVRVAIFEGLQAGYDVIGGEKLLCELITLRSGLLHVVVVFVELRRLRRMLGLPVLHRVAVIYLRRLI